MKVYRVRGYVKWTDENGKKHKVREEDYDAMVEDELDREPMSEDVSWIESD